MTENFDKRHAGLEKTDPADTPDKSGKVAPGDGQGLFSNIVRRTDNDFAGKRDQSLIGQDMPDDDEDEDDPDKADR